MTVQGGNKKREKLVLGKYSFPLGERTLIMGVLNVTPDSFSDGGKFNTLDHALSQAAKMAEEGADIIDVGGESTRPGHVPVSPEEELDRALPIIKKLKQQLDLPVSIDTYKAPVAREALEAGVDMVNDIWGLKADPDIAQLVSSFQVPICLMHNRNNTHYKDLINDLINELRESIETASQAGIPPGNIVIDPGIGFGKDLEGNLIIMNRLEELQVLGYPILLGTSRKSMIGKILNVPVEDRIEGTAATVTLGIAKGTDIIRVHDVKEMKRVAVMTDAMVRRDE